MKEVRDNIDLQDPLKSFRPGIFEPDDLSDNAPMKLFHLCAKYLVTHINLNPLTRKLPSEVCDNLIEVCFVVFFFGKQKITPFYRFFV